MIQELYLKSLEPVKGQDTLFGKTKTELRRVISADENGTAIAIVGMEVVTGEYSEGLEPIGTLCVLTPDDGFLKSLFFDYYEYSLHDRIECVIKIGGRPLRHSVMRPVGIDKKKYICLHYDMEREYGTYEEQLNAITESYHAVAGAITDTYKLYLENRCKKKKIELFDKYILHESCPLNVAMNGGSMLNKYKVFSNECQNKYLSTLKKLCPHEYERLMLSTKLLNFRFKKN